MRDGTSKRGSAARSASPRPASPTAGDGSLAEVLSRVGAGVWLLSGPADATVQSVVLWDPTTLGTALPPRAVVCLAGFLLDDPRLEEAVVAARDAGAVAVVARAGAAPVDAFRALGETYGVTTVLADQSWDWLRLARMITSAAAVSGTDAVAGARIGDLFTFANAVASMTGGATAIVDPAGRVLGFSTLPQQVVDDQRRDVTLLMAELESPAVDPQYQQLYASTEPLVLQPEPGQLPRVAVAVRSDGEVLGTIWVVADTTGTQQRALETLPSLVDAAALHLHHARSEIDLRRARHAQLLVSLLTSTSESTSAALALGRQEGRWHLLAMLSVDTASPTSARADRLVLRASSWLQIVHPTALVAEIDAHLVMLFSGDRGRRPRDVEESLEDFCRGSSTEGSALAVVVGSPTDRPSSLPQEFRRMQRLMSLHRAGVVVPARGQHLMHLADHARQLDLAEMGELWRATGGHATDVLDDVRAHDERAGTPYLETLRVYLACDRNLAATAGRLHVHQNTARYRLAKLEETFGLDLSDLDTLSWLVLQLRYAAR